MPSRRSRHPLASPSLAPERWTFAGKNTPALGTFNDRHSPSRAFHRLSRQCHHCQHQETPNDHSSPPTWSKKMGHHHRNAVLQSRRLCSPPIGAAAPASADSRPCSETHCATCKVERVGTAKPEGGRGTTIWRRPSSTTVSSCRPDAVAGALQALCLAGPKSGL
jgi:hypothetical protein